MMPKPQISSTKPSSSQSKSRNETYRDKAVLSCQFSVSASQLDHSLTTNSWLLTTPFSFLERPPQLTRRRDPGEFENARPASGQHRDALRPACSTRPPFPPRKATRDAARLSSAAACAACPRKP